jgi:protein-S-isoprenylcysteine O-methyltransferase Ste14
MVMTVIYGLLISACWIVFLIYWLISAAGAKRNVGRTWRWWGLRFVIAIVVILLLESRTFSNVGAQYSHATTNPLTGGIGVLLCIIGIAFAIWARMHIGKNWGMPMSVKENPELVTSGPYAYVRHPIYTGALLAIFGTALAVGLWWLLTFIICGAYFVYSATQEEKLMNQQFPTQYPEYRKRTKMLIPFIW